MRAALAQSQEVAEDALIMFRGDSMVCENFVICGEECFEWRILRLLGVADNLEEDVDVCEGGQRESSGKCMFLSEIYAPWSLKGGNSSMADESGIRRVVVVLLTRFRSVV